MHYTSHYIQLGYSDLLITLYVIVVICSDVEVLVLSVVVLFAANMSVIIMLLEFGRRPTKKLKKFCSSVALYGYKLAFHPPLVRWKYNVLWLLHKARHGTLQHYSHSQSGTTFTLLTKKRSVLC